MPTLSNNTHTTTLSDQALAENGGANKPFSHL